MSNGLSNESGCIVLTWHILFSAETYGLLEVQMDYLFKASFLFGVKIFLETYQMDTQYFYFFKIYK